MPITIIVSIVLILLVVWFTPKTFGKGVSPEQVRHISVFDGNTGAEFMIDSPDDIKYIIENIQSISMKKSGISLGKLGYSLKISYVGENGEDLIPLFIMNSDTTIRKDPFFYSCEGGLCFDYIKGLEGK